MSAAIDDGANVTPTIAREELREKLESGDVLLLDAQGPGWYEREHLPSAHKMPPSNVESALGKIAPDRTAEIVVYCWSETCSTSAAAARILQSFGYRNVKRYAGGKKDWLEAGLPIVTKG